ncbi:MAG: ATP-binding protein, partial [Anaerolineales bacterium]
NTLYRINKEVASSVDPNDIFQKVVDLLWKDFGYYYVQIYLIDQENEVLALQAGSGEIGAQLKSQGYIMAPDKGIVGRVARTNQHFLTNDVSAVDFYVPHSLLPLTHAELALPLRVREKTLGVLDLQHRPPNTFDDDDLGLMTTIADQVAVAIEKTKLYRDLQEALKKEKKTRAHLVKTDKLAAMGRLLASVAHELNNPLQGIQNALYLVKLEPGLSQQAHEDLDLTLSEANRMSELINRLWSTYQPVTSDEFHLEDINVIVSEVHKLTMTHMRHSNITFEFESDPIFPLISCIRDQIKQVLLNLVLNGVDAMPEGGKLSVYLQYHANEDGVRIIVEDTGMGIDPDDLLNIFDPFFTTKPGGTGLGLAITYDIIQKHQGHIDVESQMGEGTAFKIWLPFKHE